LYLLPATGLLVAAAPPASTKAVSQPPSAAPHPVSAAPDVFSRDIAPLVKKYCVGCHGEPSPAAHLSLAVYHDTASVLKARNVWEKVSRYIATKHMPPQGLPQPTQEERERLVNWIDATFSSADCKLKDPGRVTMRRLNRAEYNNTIRDLIGLDLHPADDFPSDDVGYGFDNIGDVLSISPLLMEKYMTAAETVAKAAIITPEARREQNLKDPPPPSQKQIIFCSPAGPAQYDACARRIIAAFARRAYRRPVTTADVDRLMRCFHLATKHGQRFERGIQLAVEGALISPDFLFRVERERPSDAGMLGQYEMASRLSYFLWSSMPDEELMSLAAKGKLQDPKVLAAQARRMLKDPKARALADNFAAQWLTLRKLAIVQPNPRQFPQFNNSLRQAMRTETEMFFEAVAREDRSVLDFLDGRYSYVNGPLSKLYGIPGVTGDEFRHVWLTGEQRRGVLTQASVLTVTSNPTRTSPVKRGKWVLEQILGTPPPPQPANVPPLPEGRRGQPLQGTLRQRMERHRSDPMCASCHQQMDPIGFGMENFDAIGRWRTTDGGQPIDASGVLPDGQKFDGQAELVQILKAKRTLFLRCLTGKLLTYALGRGVETSDNCNIDHMVQNIAQQNYRFSALVAQIVESDPFRKRKVDLTSTPVATAKTRKRENAKIALTGKRQDGNIAN
jgi:hypothetical protein